MPDSPRPDGTLSLEAARRHDRICDRLEASWRAGAPLRIEDLLAEVPEAERPTLLRELIRVERELGGPACAADDYRARFPDFAPLIDTLFRDPTAGGLDLGRA